ncbi:velvet factor-domain-containing protein [Aspergillus crustosus]
MRKTEVVCLKSILSDRFAVSPPKSFPGMAESTFLSRSFADQGVKLRIRKEPRTLIKRSAPRPEEFPQALPPRSPERSSIQIPGSNYPASAYQPTNRDYGYYAPVKRQRTSVDFGTRGIYDADGRMRQMEAYPQPAAMYGQPGGYPNPMMPGYPSGHAGVPDYAMSYGIPSSTQVPQMQDPTAQSRSSQQATMQSLGMVNQPGTPTPDSTRAMMQQGYPRSQYSTSSTVLPPLQSRNYPPGTNGATRSYYEQSPQATPILPSQPLGTSDADRYGVTPGQTGYEQPGSANGTPR